MIRDTKPKEKVFCEGCRYLGKPFMECHHPKKMTQVTTALHISEFAELIYKVNENNDCEFYENDLIQFFFASVFIVIFVGSICSLVYFHII